MHRKVSVVRRYCFQFVQNKSTTIKEKQKKKKNLWKKKVKTRAGTRVESRRQ